MVDVTNDLGPRPGGGQAWKIAPVGMPGKRWRRRPRAEFAIEVIVEDFECVPRDAPRRGPSLNPSLDQRAALFGIGDGTPVWAEELVVRSRSRDLPHALFPQLIRAVSHRRS